MKKENKTNKKTSENKISRKQAIKKVGITALTVSSLLFLETKKASATSKSPTPPGSGW